MSAGEHLDLGDDDVVASLLSAYADDEVTLEERAAVEQLLERRPDLRSELDELTQVRSLLRDLPPVDPPFGFYERMLRSGDPAAPAAPTSAVDAAKARPSSKVRGGIGRAVAALAASAASIVLILGITPITDPIVPPVEAFAARHEDMAEQAVDPAGGQNIQPPPATTAPSTTARSTTAPAATDTAGFDPVPEHVADSLPAPYAAPKVVAGERMPRVSTFEADDGTIHAMYGAGGTWVSVYEQTGDVGWDRMPRHGSTVMVAGVKAWQADVDGHHVVVVSRPPLVFTVVGTASNEMMLLVAAELRPADHSVGSRATAACRALVDHFGLDS